ncbi:sensor histidine kinase [Patulibacter sp.]|uniref:sensor histidine kinase n=1 Tax=Patulibacter sp. TaxID=1912859 RepID=UPI00272627AF|nr:hypothetical protein [Patulibacter sp.]MDO9407243.1 hypothetical protein [Patulibacter sp.]
MSWPGLNAVHEGELATGPIPHALRRVSTQARAVFRILAAIAVGALLLVNVDENSSRAATVVPLLAGLYVVASTAIAWPRATLGAVSRRSDVVRAVADIIALCAVAVAVAEPRVAVLLVLCAIPIGYGLTLPAATVVGLAAVSVVACVVVWATGPLFDGPGLDESSLILLALAITWSGLVASLIAVERDRRAERITRLSESVHDMLHQALRAGSTERSRVADLLHDDVLQLLLSTRHDISDAMNGDLDLLPDARSGLEAATHRLRETIAALRDDGDDEQPLAEGLSALAVAGDRSRGAAVEVATTRRLGRTAHPVLLAATRDLVRDAEVSSAAARVRIDADLEDDEVVLVLRHDDRRFTLGLDPSADATRTLTQLTARIRAMDGGLDVEHGAQGERIVTIRVPVAPASPLLDPALPWSPGAMSGPTPKLG